MIALLLAAVLLYGIGGAWAEEGQNDRERAALIVDGAEVTAAELEAAVCLHMFRAALQCAGYGYGYDMKDPMNILDAADKEVFEIERRILIRKLAEEAGILPLDGEGENLAYEAWADKWEEYREIALSDDGPAFLPAADYDETEGDAMENLTRYFESFGLTENTLYRMAQEDVADRLLMEAVTADMTDSTEDEMIDRYTDWFLEKYHEAEITEDQDVISMVREWLAAE